MNKKPTQPPANDRTSLIKNNQTLTDMFFETSWVSFSETEKKMPVKDATFDIIDWWIKG